MAESFGSCWIEGWQSGGEGGQVVQCGRWAQPSATLHRKGRTFLRNQALIHSSDAFQGTLIVGKSPELEREIFKDLDQPSLTWRGIPRKAKIVID